MFSTPKVAGDLLFIAGLDGVTYSLDASSGRVRWKRKLAAALSKRWPQGHDHLCRHKRSAHLSPSQLVPTARLTQFDVSSAVFSVMSFWAHSLSRLASPALVRLAAFIFCTRSM